MFSESSDKAQSQEAFEESCSEPRQLKFSSAAVFSETDTSAHQWKDSPMEVLSDMLMEEKLRLREHFNQET